MKQRKTIKVWCLRIVLVFLLVGMMPQTMSAYDYLHELMGEGRWELVNDEWIYIKRSLPSITPTSFFDGNTLSIENLIVEQNVAISIKDSYEQIVFEETRQLFSSSVAISLDFLSDGEYILELITTQGRYLVTFQSIN